MAGFFGTVKAINKCTDELLVVGKDYALRFKGGEINAQDYESEMVGKIYELTNKYAGGDEDLEKYLKQHFADPSVKFLKEGIRLYTDSMQQPQTKQNLQINQQEPQTQEPTPIEKESNPNRMKKSLDDVNSNARLVTSNKKVSKKRR